MKTFNASDMAHKRTEIFEAASDEGAIIQRKNTNGDVKEEFMVFKIPSSEESMAVITYSIDKLVFFRNLVEQREEALCRVLNSESENAQTNN